jgi:hypothetical protein
MRLEQMIKHAEAVSHCPSRCLYIDDPVQLAAAVAERGLVAQPIATVAEEGAPKTGPDEPQHPPPLPCSVRVTFSAPVPDTFFACVVRPAGSTICPSASATPVAAGIDVGECGLVAERVFPRGRQTLLVEVRSVAVVIGHP